MRERAVELYNVLPCLQVFLFINRPRILWTGIRVDKYNKLTNLKLIKGFNRVPIATGEYNPISFVCGWANEIALHGHYKHK